MQGSFMAASGASGWWFRHVPALDSLRHYSWQAFAGDLSAGLTVATVAVPQAMAYAILAGVPPQHGLYTAIVMTAVGALFDSSKLLINGPTNAISIALFSALAVVPEEQKVPAAVLLTFLVGAIQLGIAFLRLGDLTRYVSHSVIVGFTLGAGALIVLDQSKNLLGLRSSPHATDHFLLRLSWSATHGGGIHWLTLLIGIGTIVIVVLVRRLNGVRARRGARFPVPQHLVAVAVMAALVWLFDLDQQGVRIIRDVGTIPPALPAFQLPELDWIQVRQLAGNAFAIAVLGLLEAVAMAKAIAGRTGQKLDINQQCLSEGAANMAGSFFQCMPGSGSLTRSAINQQAGAYSQWSGVFSAAAVAGTVLLFAQFAQFIPLSALAGLLFLAAFRLVDGKQLIFHLRATRFDAGVVLATALAAVFISVEFCIVIGVFLSFVLYMPRAAQVRMVEFTRIPGDGIRERLPTDTLCARLHCYALEGDLFFGVEPEIDKHFDTIAKQAQPDLRVVILILKRARNPDAGFLRLLKALHADLQQRRVTLLLCGVRPDLRKALANAEIDTGVGAPHIFPDGTNGATARDALQLAYKLIGDETCASCPRRQEKEEPQTREALNYEI
jgi:SulP family sulfate permease